MCTDSIASYFDSDYFINIKARCFKLESLLPGTYYYVILNLAVLLIGHKYIGFDSRLLCLHHETVYTSSVVLFIADFYHEIELKFLAKEKVHAGGNFFQVGNSQSAVTVVSHVYMNFEPCMTSIV